jgi:Uma2 family endonuclease
VWQYERLVEAGVLTEDDQVELINGFLVLKMAKGPVHTATVIDTRDAFLRLIPGGWHVQTEAPVRIPDFDEPEPDVAVVRGKARDYVALNRPPEASEVCLNVEVAESSLPRDRGEKMVAYATGRVPVYWIINLLDGQVEVYTDPVPGFYRSHQTFRPGESVPMIVTGAEVGRIPVDHMLP